MPVTLRLDPERPGDLDRAASILQAGGTVAFPTETVYGLGANALDPAAVACIFAAKQRPAWDPLIVHIAEPAQLAEVAQLSEATPELESRVHALANAFWPGPLTLLLPRSSQIPDAVTAGRALVGVRIPSHPVALDLLRIAHRPVAAPSANTFGHTSPTTAVHVLADLAGRIDAVVDAGPTSVGLESTVLDPASMTIYRPGAVTPEQIAAICGTKPSIHIAAPVTTPREALPSPGVGLRHYAPRARVKLVDGTPEALRAAYNARQERTGILLPDGWQLFGVDEHTDIFRWGNWDDSAELAARLFAGLRDLDDRAVSTILCPLPPPSGLGQAIRDRLEKASREE